VLLALVVAPGSARGDLPVPPWYPDPSLALPTWARSVAPKPDDRGKPGDMVIFSEPSRSSKRRGLTLPGTTLPLYGAQQGPGCDAAWWLVGPLAWACSDQAELSPADPVPRTPAPSAADGLMGTYYFVGPDGASAYASLDAALEGAPDRELEGGWGVAVAEQKSSGGQTFVRTTKDLWIDASSLFPARPSSFHGEQVGSGRLDFAWVRADKANTWAVPSTKGKPTGSRARFTRVAIAEDSTDMVRVDDTTWMERQDLARPAVSDPPAEVVLEGERWIDVDLSTQTLVAYEGRVPVYATLVSTGRPGPDATPRGVHRIWVKILTSDMGGAGNPDVEARYSLEDVPYVQFFDDAVALHGTYWHRDFGHTHSHGCVNLAPLDARWLFGFTGPRLPAGWTAAYPTRFDPGSVVRVR
jgi:hypothetical protein